MIFNTYVFKKYIIRRKKYERKKIIHVAQEPHSEADCRINDDLHRHPDMDCGHTVWEGPAMALDEYKDRAPAHNCDPDHGNTDDVEHGHGVQ